jgi:hypothetical protein
MISAGSIRHHIFKLQSKLSQIRIILFCTEPIMRGILVIIHYRLLRRDNTKINKLIYYTDFLYHITNNRFLQNIPRKNTFVDKLSRNIVINQRFWKIEKSIARLWHQRGLWSADYHGKTLPVKSVLHHRRYVFYHFTQIWWHQSIIVTVIIVYLKNYPLSFILNLLFLVE